MRRSKKSIVIILALSLIGAIWQIYTTFKPSDIVVLRLGESYEQVRERSRSTLPSRDPSWGPLASVIAKLHFDDPEYGFTTPVSVFLSMGYSGPQNSNVDSVQLSPQLEPLSIDEVLTIVMNIQDQLLKRGWHPFQYSRMRPIEDTPQFRRLIRECDFPMSVWNGGEKFQVTIDVGCHSIPQQPGKERYVVTLELGPQFWTDRPGE